MQILEALGKTGSIQSIARELGLSESQVESGASALIPAILGGFKRHAQTQPAGLEGIRGMLGRLGGGRLVDEVLAPQPTNIAPGNDILGQIFGSKDVSRTVAQNASARTGLDPSLLKKMLPVLAMLVAGYMAKQSHASSPPAPRTGNPGDSIGNTPGIGSTAGGV